MTDKKLLDRLASLSPEQREALLKQLQKKKSQGAEPRKDAIQRYARDTNRLAMSYAQQRLWFIDQLQSGSASYNISAALRLTGPLDVEALRMSFDEIVLRHEVLRTIFVTDDGQGRQVINEHQRWELPTISLDTLSSREQEEVINTRYKGDSLTSFDLINGPLLRTRLIRLSNIEHVIIVTMHHIISDGWSMGVFIREMALLYDAFRQDKASPLKPLPIQYADYSLWQREWLSGERLERQLSYWKTRLDGVTVLELPTDFARPPVHTFKGNNIHFSLDPRLTQQLNELSKKQGVTLFMTLFATLQTLLHRYSGQDDICIGTPIAGRVRPEVESLIGCFVNTLAIRSDLQG
ncbi:MAG: condensation domain-containing protein, partial [Ketobacter sp.]